MEEVLKYISTLTVCMIVMIFAGAFCPDIVMPRAYGLAEAMDIDGSNAKAVHALDELGEGVNIGFIAGRNGRVTHEAFKGVDGEPNAFNYDFSDDGIISSNHDTWMAGIAVSKGGAYPNNNNRGAAPGANIYIARVSNDDNGVAPSWMENALHKLVIDRNCRVVMTGFTWPSASVPANGTSQWTLRYDYYAYLYNVVFSNSPGNTAGEVQACGDAYNGITTGGLILNDPNNEYVYAQVGSQSGAGPTSDVPVGRRKPDLTAPAPHQMMPSGGYDTHWYERINTLGETSLSVPHTAGVAALLLGLADDSAEAYDNRNEVIRAVIVNSTFPNINDRNNTLTTGQTYHDQRGYGRIDAMRAYELLAAGNVTSEPQITVPKGWAYAEMTSNYQEDSYYIAGEKNQRLVLTATWNRGVIKGGSTYSEESPKFNLNLTIKDPQGATVFARTDTPDNLEKADILLDEDGVYEIILKNTTTKKDHWYAFAFELLEPIEGDFNTDYIVNTGDLATFGGHWLRQDCDETNDYCQGCDFEPNGKVDLADFAAFSLYWLGIDPAYY